MAVTERLPGGALVVDGSRLYKVDREFDIDATSRFHATSELKSEEGIEWGIPFVDHDGVSPVDYLRCTHLEINARTPPPGGTGEALYHVIAHYGVMDGVIPYPDGPAVWRTEGALQEEPADVGKPLVGGEYQDEQAITKSAGVPFTNPLRTLRPNLVGVAVWIKTGVSWSQALKFARTYRGKINSAEWLGADKHEVLCRDLLPSLVQPGLVRYEARFEYRNSYTLYEGQENEVEVPGWNEATPDRGLHWLDKDNRRRKIMEPVSEMCAACKGTGKADGGDCEDCEGKGYIETGQMQPVTVPVLLDGAGKELGRDGNGDLLPCVVLVFGVLREADFNGIGIS